MTDGSMTDDSEIIVDKSSFVYKDGVKICKVTSSGTLLFHDKDKRRSAIRGTNQVEVSPEALLRIIEPEIKTEEPLKMESPDQNLDKDG